MGFEPIKKKVVLSIDNPSMSQYIEIKQGFIGTLELIISFLYQGKTFEIPEGTTAILRMLKPDKHQVLNNYEVSGNNVIVNMTLQMQKVPGDASFEVILMNDGEAIPSSTCVIKIIPNVHDDSNIESTDEYVSVIETLAKADEVITKATKITDDMGKLIDLVNSETLLIYKPYVNTYNDISTTYPDPEIGWITKTIDTGNWYRYNGSDWIRFNNDALDKVGDLTQSTNTSKDNVIAITNELNENKLEKTGDTKDNTVTFEEAEEDAELQSGMTHATLWGLVKFKISELNENKLEKTGDSKDNTVSFEQAEEDTELQSGMTHSKLFGLIKLKLANILSALAGKLDKDGDSKNNTVTFDQVEEDAELQSGMTHATLWGLVKLKFANILTALANKIDKNAITHQTSTNDPDKIPSSQVTNALANSIASQAQSIAYNFTKYNHTYPDSFGGQTFTQILDDFISNNYKSALCFYWEGETQPSDTVGEIANNRINALYEFYRTTTNVILVRITTYTAIYSKIIRADSQVFIPWVKATNTWV